MAARLRDLAEIFGRRAGFGADFFAAGLEALWAGFAALRAAGFFLADAFFVFDLAIIEKAPWGSGAEERLIKNTSPRAQGEFSQKNQLFFRGLCRCYELALE